MYSYDWRRHFAESVPSEQPQFLFLGVTLMAIVAGLLAILLLYCAVFMVEAIWVFKINIDPSPYTSRMFFCGVITNLMQSFVKMEERHAGLLSFFGKPIPMSVEGFSFLPTLGGVIGGLLSLAGINCYRVWRVIPLYPYTVTAVASGYTVDKKEFTVAYNGEFHIPPGFAYLFGMRDEKQALEQMENEVSIYARDFIHRQTSGALIAHPSGTDLGYEITKCLPYSLWNKFGIEMRLRMKGAAYMDQSVRSLFARVGSVELEQDVVKQDQSHIQAFAEKLGLSNYDAGMLFALSRGGFTHQFPAVASINPHRPHGLT